MDEKAKKILYDQLLKISEISHIKGEKLIDLEMFLGFEDKEALNYSLSFRNRVFEKCKANKLFKKELNISDFYLQLPDMDLSGKDLSDVYLSMFMPGIAKEEMGYKKVFVTSKINLKDTKCVINLATIRPIIISEDRCTYKRNNSRY